MRGHPHENRDHVMARLASALASARATQDAIEEALAFFNNPDDDTKGKHRKELVATALETVGCATRALEAAEGVLETMRPTELKEGEPWDDDEDDDDEEDEEDEDDDD